MSASALRFEGNYFPAFGEEAPPHSWGGRRAAPGGEVRPCFAVQKELLVRGSFLYLLPRLRGSRPPAQRAAGWGCPAFIYPGCRLGERDDPAPTHDAPPGEGDRERQQEHDRRHHHRQRI